MKEHLHEQLCSLQYYKAPPLDSPDHPQARPVLFRSNCKTQIASLITTTCQPSEIRQEMFLSYIVSD